MPELVLALISIVIALLGVVLTTRLAEADATGHRPDPLEEAAAARRDARTAADTARASARAAHVAELAEFDAEARRILDALDAPCVCSQVSTHEWDEHTQTYRQRWTVPEHFPSCVKHWPATTGTPPPGTIADQQHQGGPLLTPAARVNAERARYVAEAWARRVTDAAALDRRESDDWYGVRYTPGGVRYRYPTAELDATLARLAELQAETRRAPATITTYGVPADCTCVPDHAHAALANTHVVHRADCATNRGPHAAEWRWMSDNG